jgi:hypothetical protein
MIAGHTKAAPVAWTRAAAGVLGALVVSFAVITFAGGGGYIPAPDALGFDYESYRVAVSRLLAGDGFYEARQLAGPWTFETYREPLYPPSSLLVFVPFAFLPAVLWWAVPAAVIAWSIRVHRPNPLALGLIVIALLSRTSVYAWWVGNPGIWLAAAVAAATIWGTGPLVLFKPSYFPLAMIGFARRGWWAGAAVLGLAVLVTLPLWADYLTVMRNAPGLGYSVLGDIPLVAVPLLAWMGRRR